VTLPVQNVHSGPLGLPPGRHGPTDAEAGAAQAAKTISVARRKRTDRVIGGRRQTLRGQRAPWRMAELAILRWRCFSCPFVPACAWIQYRTSSSTHSIAGGEHDAPQVSGLK
jgi:hypothetical protein